MMRCCMMSGNVGVAFLLISLAAGYVICSIANREKKPLQNIGYLIGGFIVVLSLILIARTALIGLKKCMMMSKQGCPTMSGKPMMPPMQNPDMGGMPK